MSNEVVSADQIGKFILSQKVAPMTNEQASAFIGIGLAGEDGMAGVVEKTFVGRIMQTRLEWVGAHEKGDARTKAFLVMISGGNPGKMVLLTALLYHLTDHGTTPMTFERMCQQIFPWGIPTEATLEAAWEMQKKVREGCGTDNWLDLNEAWV